MLLATLLLFTFAFALWPENACTLTDAVTAECQQACNDKTCPKDHWCSCGSCLPLSYCLTACNYVGCGGAEAGRTVPGMCCDCGYCHATSASQLNEAGSWGTMTEQGRFDEMREMGLEVEVEPLTRHYSQPGEQLTSQPPKSSNTAVKVFVPLGVCLVLLLGFFAYRQFWKDTFDGRPLTAHDGTPLSPRGGLKLSSKELERAYQSGGVTRTEL